MSLELINTLATFGTFLVIAATAVAAIVQLRHARSSNHIAALNELRETMEAPDFEAAQRFVQTQLSAKLQDPAFRYQYGDLSARTAENQPLIAKANIVGNYFESMGVLVKTGLVDKKLVFEMFSYQATATWERLAPVVAITRRKLGDALWENFEYLAVLSQQWMAAHPKGTYPAGVPRIGLKDEFLEADKQYAASLATA
jgi:hypothetical protein